jgi:hypothetical protein
MITHTAYILALLVSSVATAQAQLDSDPISSDTVSIRGTRYVVQLDSTHTFRVVSNGDTAILGEDYFPGDLKLVDFDADGATDILVTFMGNVPDVCDLFLFDRQRRTFRQVRNFRRFPAPTSIEGTPYYYSYHRSGCADMNWNSDLFRIENFTAIQIADISGVECDGMDQGVFVTKIGPDGEEKPVATFTLDVLDRPRYKWGFIEYYWKNVFLRPARHRRDRRKR